MKNISEKVKEKMEVHSYVQNIFPENRVVYEIMWKNVADLDRSQATIQ